MGTRDEGALTRWLVRPAVRAGIWVRTRFIDAAFVHRQGLTPTIGARLLKYPAIGGERLGRVVNATSQDVIFEKYLTLNSAHYKPGGRGYSTVPESGIEDRRRRYHGQGSRLAYFADTFPDLLRYEDGDTFLELGCGTGQNIRWLVESFPDSRVVGVDLSEDAVGLVRDCEPSRNVAVSVGDISSPDFVRGLMLADVDHVILSHVFSLIFASSVHETRTLRQALVDVMASNCRKSVIIVDHFGARGQTSIAIEQATRAVVSDDVLAYFEGRTDGRTVMARSEVSQAVMFQRKAHAIDGEV